jgi:succinate dehydrogenase/fumarate reductase flavoprotein subunit
MRNVSESLSSSRETVMTKLSFVGGGLSGLVAAITAADCGTDAAAKASAPLRSQPTSRAAAPAGRA